jgi:hypothetical protein
MIIVSQTINVTNGERAFAESARGHHGGFRT